MAWVRHLLIYNRSYVLLKTTKFLAFAKLKQAHKHSIDI